jgi:hypothetical protein
MDYATPLLKEKYIMTAAIYQGFYPPPWKRIEAESLDLSRRRLRESKGGGDLQGQSILSIYISLGLLPLGGPMIPFSSMSSMSRAARL